MSLFCPYGNYLETENVYIGLTIQSFLQGEKRVGPPTKDDFKLHCLRVDYEYLLNANNAQLDVGTSQVDGNLQLVVVQLLLIHCLMCCPHVCGDSVFCPCFVMHYLHVSSFAIILMRERELVVLLYLSPWCLMTVIVICLFLTVPWVGLMFVVFPDQTHLLLGLKAIFQLCMQL